MNFAPVELDPGLAAFQAEVRDFCAEFITDAVHAREYETGQGHDWALHRALGARGWLYPQWPVESGGAGLDAARVKILNFELDRANPPARSRGTTAMAVTAIQTFGSDELKADVLPRAARGEVIICLGWTEPESGSDVAAASCRAVRDDDEWVVTGQKFFTSGADLCQYTFLLARTDPDVPKHRGLSTFLVPLDSPGVEIRGIRTVGGEQTTIVFYDDVRVPDRYRLGEVGGGWGVMSQSLAQEHGDERDSAMGQVGDYHRHLRAALADAVAWARTTTAADGTPLIEDPSVRRRLATHALACLVADEAPTGSMVRVLGSCTLLAGAPDLMDLLGPAGLLERGIAGAVGEANAEFAYRVGPETAIYGGTTDIHRSLIAEAGLGLPKSRPTR